MCHSKFHHERRFSRDHFLSRRTYLSYAAVPCKFKFVSDFRQRERFFLRDDAKAFVCLFLCVCAGLIERRLEIDGRGGGGARPACQKVLCEGRDRSFKDDQAVTSYCTKGGRISSTSTTYMKGGHLESDLFVGFVRLV